MSEVAAPVGRVVAMLVGEPVRTIESLISTGGELAACGLLQVRETNDWIAGSGGRFDIPWRIDSCLDHHFADFPALRDAFLGAPLQPSLNLSDYEHVADDLELVTRLIQGASLESAQGVNILLFGPPGTGKTELAKLAAAAAGVTLYAAGEEQVAGREISRSERLSDPCWPAASKRRSCSTSSRTWPGSSSIAAAPSSISTGCWKRTRCR